MKPLNVGILGLGFIGKVHAYGYQNLALYYDPVPVEARVTHVCTSRPETAEKGRAVVGADAATTDYREITENPAIDIVHICTPNDLHYEALRSAMAHGKHIYCDKPLTATLDEALAVRAALDDYRGVAQMTFHNRFFPAMLRAKQYIDGGELGDLLEYRALYMHSGSADPDAPLKWKLSAAHGGGVIADLGSHVLDLMHHFLGDYASLLATTHIAYPDRPSLDDPNRRVPVEAEDCVMMLTRHARGGLGHIEATKIATGTEDELRFEIHGSKGALRYNSMHSHFLEVFDPAQPDQPLGGTRGWTAVATGQRYPAPATAFPGPKFVPGWLRGHVACLAHFLESVATNTPAQPDLRQGIYIQQIMELARQSAASGQWAACADRATLAGP